VGVVGKHTVVVDVAVPMAMRRRAFGDAEVGVVTGAVVDDEAALRAALVLDSAARERDRASVRDSSPFTHRHATLQQASVR
jgi:hypothetical protein